MTQEHHANGEEEAGGQGGSDEVGGGRERQGWSQKPREEVHFQMKRWLR